MRKVIVVAGPTGVGKTEYAISIANRFNGEIVSCDSMQLYKYMDIGSAKPDSNELAQARHHLVDVIDPREDFSVVKYNKMAKDAIEDIFSRAKIPVIAGGTGLYLNSLIYDMDFGVQGNNSVFRQKMTALAEEKGAQYVHELLKKKDPEAAERLHPNNLKRVIRALEACENGGSIRDFGNVSKKTADYDVIMIGLTRDRAGLYDRINKRVDLMVSAGLIDEVRSLMNMGLTSDDTAMKGIGYKEIIDYFDGKYSLEEAINTVKKNTRHYAKRQMTWFRRYKELKWFDIDLYPDKTMALDDISNWIESKMRESDFSGNQ